MILTKVNHANGNTYVTVRAVNSEEILVITVQGKATIEMNNLGNALLIKLGKEE